jgi:DNA invertase Pin-like site-specific DNA recombinase
MTIQKLSKPICISYIRFSTPDQIKGNSLKRQLRQSQEYAEKHDLVVDERFNLKDLGLSAYHGDHKTKGALGSLLVLVDKGQIPKGSVLLVESLDRLSRDKIPEALTQFLQILAKGIKIVTLIDEREYDKNFDIGQIQYSLTVMSRAHEESATKAFRLQKAWQYKRLDIDKKKLTSIAPAWLKLNKKSQQFEMVPDRDKLIKRIYKLHLEGNGADKIARTFNAEHIPAWKSNAGWHKSYIQKILHNKAVLGEFQPHTMDKRKRIAIGEPVLKYFPQVISKEIFDRVQERLSANENKGGKNGNIRSLFAHITKCGYCGAPAHYINKSNGNEYLTCDNARRGRGCVKTSFRYKEFEDTFLKCCSELDVKSVLPHKADIVDNKIASLRVKKEELSAGLKQNGIKQKNLDAMLGDDETETFRDKLSKKFKDAYSQETTLRAELNETEKELERFTNVEQKAGTQLKSISELLTMLQKKTGTELIAIRQKLRLEIRKLVERIEVFPEGVKGKILSLEEEPIRYIDSKDNLKEHRFSEFDPDIHHSKEEFKNQLIKKKRQIEKYIEDTTGKQHRLFSIWFQAGGFKEIYHEDGVFKISLSGKNYMDSVKNILSKI